MRGNHVLIPEKCVIELARKRYQCAVRTISRLRKRVWSLDIFKKSNREADLIDVSLLVSFLLSLHQLQLPLQFCLVKWFYNRLSRKIAIANLGGAVERRRNNER